MVMNSSLQRAVAVTLILSTGCTANCGRPVSGNGSSGAADADPQRGTTASQQALSPLEEEQARLEAALGIPPDGLPPEARSARLDDILNVVEGELRQIPTDTFDPDAVIRMVGTDPSKLFGWVRDHTRLIPYKGVLRGATGVLMDRYGNSLDRALLLADLLKRTGHDLQLASATLSEGLTREVVAVVSSATSPTVAASPAAAGSGLDEAIASHVQRFGGDAAQLRQRLDVLRQTRMTAEQEIRRRVAAQSAVLRESLGATLRGGPAGLTPAQRADLSDHWWVRAKLGDAWVDLDPTRPDAQPSQVLTKATRIVVPRISATSFTIACESEVVVERIVDGELREQPVLDHVFRVADIVTARVQFGHSSNATATDSADQQPAEWLKTTIESATTWTPFLSIGPEQIVQSSFTLAGELQQAGKADSPTSGLSPREA
jgi:hypothetical protein